MNLKEIIQDKELLEQMLQDECNKYGLLQKVDTFGNIIYERTLEGKIIERTFNNKNLLETETIKENEEEILITKKYYYNTYDTTIKIETENVKEKTKIVDEFDDFGNIIEVTEYLNGEIVKNIVTQYNELNMLILEDDGKIRTEYNYINNNPYLFYVIIKDKKTENMKIKYCDYRNGYKEFTIDTSGNKIWYFNGQEIKKETTVMPI